MKQKISVRAIIRNDDRILLVRRAEGRESIRGMSELPGGDVDYREQPSDALRRYLRTDLAVEPETLQLQDTMSFVDPDDPQINYVFIIYNVSLNPDNRAIDLAQKYDKYEWLKMSEIQPNLITKSTQILLGLHAPEVVPQEVSEKLSKSGVKKSTLDHLIIYSDGGSRGNPGPSASGFVIMDSAERMIAEGGAYIGITTNNQAEYQAIYFGLQRAVELGARTVDFRMDSLLAVNQLNGIYKIRNRDLWPIYERIKELSREFDRVTFTHVRREFNKPADAMVNKLLDEQQARDNLQNSV